jgi:FAD/FMN-containing dehydrogenase
VGGSLSVNVHGRYAGLGPIISTVRSFRVVLADGSVVTASPTENREIFYGAIGGYGGLGVITQATLELADNVRVRRTMPVAAYGAWFRRNVQNRPGIVFHNADIYPNEYDRISAGHLHADGGFRDRPRPADAAEGVVSRRLLGADGGHGVAGGQGDPRARAGAVGLPRRARRVAQLRGELDHSFPRVSHEYLHAAATSSR